MRSPALCLCCSLLAMPVLAGPALSDALPPETALRATLDSHPALREAESLREAGSARRSALQAGPHDWIVRLAGQQRRSSDSGQPAQTDREWNVALERPWRLPGKAGLDEALGDQGLALADSDANQAFHDTARALLGSWFGWLREQAALTQWTRQLALTRQQAEAITRRHQLGDAARIERELALAQLAQASVQQQLARTRQRQAQDSLLRRFPLLPREAPESLPEPVAPEGDAAHWRSRILAQHHGLERSRLGSQNADLLARRADLERYPDPSLGIQLANERSGHEHVAGVYLSIPLGGGARRHTARQAAAEARAMHHQALASRQSIEADVDAFVAAALDAHAQWQAADTAARQLDEVARMSQRAYALGEGSLEELIQRQRQANEARLLEITQRIDALEQHFRLQLEAHQLWHPPTHEATP